MKPLEAAQSWVARGFFPIPIPFREKGPKLEGWHSLRLGKDDVSRYFNGAAQNIGVLLGDPYGATDIDLDCTEAIVIANELLPETAMIFGRQSKPRSHYFYRCDPPIRSKRLLDPINKGCIVELRCQKSDGSQGLQTVVPPSTHPEGEQIRFEPGCDGYPANVDANVLQLAVARVAAASLLIRHWPGEKSGRNQAFIALAGSLARAGWQLDDAVTFHRAIYRGLWGANANFDAARAEVAATFEKYGGGHETTGKRTLSDLMVKRAVIAAFSWLGVSMQVPPRDEDAPPKKQSAQPRIIAPVSTDLESLMDDDTVRPAEVLIEGLVPKTGLVLLGGRPKDGKSYFATQIALSVVTGQPLAGWLRVSQPGRVQLWALEDHKTGTKDIVCKLLRGARPDGLRDLRVFEELPAPLLRGGDQAVRAALREHPAELIIFNSLFKLSGSSQSTYDVGQREYDCIDRARQIALEAWAVALIVMHARKNSPGGNPVENLLGTTGTSAAADVIAELKYFRSNGAGKLTVVGCGGLSGDYKLRRHDGPDQWGWAIEDQGEDADSGETSEAVLAYLEAEGASKPVMIASALKKSFDSVYGALKRLRAKNRVIVRIDRRWELSK
jgi:hypothetical protein